MKTTWIKFKRVFSFSQKKFIDQFITLCDFGAAQAFEELGWASVRDMWR